jgi:hypothetical protein
MTKFFAILQPSKCLGLCKSVYLHSFLKVEVLHGQLIYIL